MGGPKSGILTVTLVLQSGADQILELQVIIHY
jgi:hypothetical protein